MTAPKRLAGSRPRGGTELPGEPPRRPGGCVLEGLEDAGAALERMGVGVPPLRGQLYRPRVALALVPELRRAHLGRPFWSGALAVQMAHEASLLHDDVIDGAATRRGRPTRAATDGVGAALVVGDRYLTGAYRAALGAESPAFLSAFVEAVERTVAGEARQHALAGRRITPEEYREVVEGKSGELFGAAAALGSGRKETVGRRVALGRRVGALYQRVDDLLDYCAAAGTGKEPLLDYRQRKWTWVLDLAGVEDFETPEAEVVATLFRPVGRAPTPARRGLAELRAIRDALVDEAGALGVNDAFFSHVLDGWVGAAERGVRAQEGAVSVRRAG